MFGWGSSAPAPPPKAPEAKLPRTGYLGNLTPEESAVLIKVKQACAQMAVVDPTFKSDLVLLKFCRARKFDYSLVMEMLQQHFQWRSNLFKK